MSFHALFLFLKNCFNFQVEGIYFGCCTLFNNLYENLFCWCILVYISCILIGDNLVYMQFALCVYFGVTFLTKEITKQAPVELKVLDPLKTRLVENQAIYKFIPEL